MKYNYYSWLFLFIFFLLSCTNVSLDDYDLLKTKNLKGNELLQQVINFEIEHSNHFESKVDLVDLYVLIENYEKAYEYAVRAESVIKNAPKGKKGNKIKSILYGDRAKIEYNFKNYEKALDYANKGIKLDKSHGVYIKFTKAKILFELNKKEDAIALLDDLYKSHSEAASSSNLQFYMYLLADEERYGEASLILDKFFSTGKYYIGLGSFASFIYEKNGDVAKAILSTFLDSEYYACYVETAFSEYLENLKKLETKLKTEGKLSSAENVINYLKSYYTNDLSVNYETDFFIKNYIDSVKKINSDHFTKDDMSALLNVEKNFSSYPSYYWNSYLAIKKIDSNSKEDLIPILEKIIDLGNKNLYISKAREVLGNLVGLSKEQAKKILIKNEIIAILYDFQTTGDEESLIPIFDLLELPDNIYEMFALSLIRDEYKLLKMEKVLRNKKVNCSEKLKERLNYILK